MNGLRKRRLRRRDWLQWVSAAALGTRISGCAVPAHGREPETRFPTDARARLAITSYPFRAYIDSPTNHEKNRKHPGMDLKAFPAFVVKNFGIFNVSPLVDHFSSTDPTYLDAFRTALERTHSRIVDLGLGGAPF